MLTKLLFFFALGLIVASSAEYTDRKCGDDILNLWLEVVLVIDNSKGMTRSMYDVVDNISQVFGWGTTIGTSLLNKKTTRVGLVTYNEEPSIIADLDSYNSFDDLLDGVANVKFSSSESSHLSKGLMAAEEVFWQGAITKPNRAHYRKAIIVYASTLNRINGVPDPGPIETRLREQGVTVITTVFGQNTISEADLEEIRNRFSHFIEPSAPGTLVQEIQKALLQANCYCPEGWTQYRSSFSDVFSHRYGVCIQPIPSPIAVWKTARIACRNLRTNAYLVNEYTNHKHNYVLSVVENSTGFAQPLAYHIGLSLSNGKWNWEQPTGMSSVVQQDYSPWTDGYPFVSSTLSGVMNQQLTKTSKTVGWVNVNSMSFTAQYVCEIAACDTENYCREED